MFKHDFRVIAIRAKNGSYRRFVTNAPPGLLPAEAVAEVYRLRWEVETFFKTAKSGSGLADLSSTKAHIVETIIYAVLLRATASMSALATTRARLLGKINRWINPLQWHRWFIGELRMFLRLLVAHRASMSGSARLSMLMDPNLGRIPTRRRLREADLFCLDGTNA